MNLNLSIGQGTHDREKRLPNWAVVNSSDGKFSRVDIISELSRILKLVKSPGSIFYLPEENMKTF